jgi:hypothetical protein
MTPEELKNTLEQHRLWLRGEGGQRADLSGCDLSGCNLTRADLYKANLYKANLREADLRRADLRRADLRRADLRGCDLSGCDLSGAYLTRADLIGCDLRGCDLSGAYLSGAKGIMQFGPMPTSGRMVYAVRHDSGWMVQAGCFWGTLDKLEAEIKAKHNCPIYLGFIQLLRNTTNQ